jgi:hypothetical protein
MDESSLTFSGRLLIEPNNWDPMEWRSALTAHWRRRGPSKTCKTGHEYIIQYNQEDLGIALAKLVMQSMKRLEKVRDVSPIFHNISGTDCPFRKERYRTLRTYECFFQGRLRLTPRGSGMH